MQRGARSVQECACGGQARSQRSPTARCTCGVSTTKRPDCCCRPWLQAEFAVRRGPSQQQRVPARGFIPHCITAPNHLPPTHPPSHLLHVTLDHQRPPLCREARCGLCSHGPSLAAGTLTAPHAATAVWPSSPALARPTSSRQPACPSALTIAGVCHAGLGDVNGHSHLGQVVDGQQQALGVAAAEAGQGHRQTKQRCQGEGGGDEGRHMGRRLALEARELEAAGGGHR